MLKCLSGKSRNILYTDEQYEVIKTLSSLFRKAFKKKYTVIKK